MYTDTKRDQCDRNQKQSCEVMDAKDEAQRVMSDQKLVVRMKMFMQ